VFPLLAPSQIRAHKTFHDPKYGVSFRYPSGWSDGADVDFYLGSEILDVKPEGGAAAPIAKVGFAVKEGDPRFSHTHLSGVQFVYNVISQSTPEDCRGRIQDLSRDPIVETVLRGVTYHHFSGGDAGLGHQASREIYATFREGRCYLFEEAIHTATGENSRALTVQQWKHLRRELDAVMQSVHIEERHELQPGRE
jgi:hypothetical protein